jgi:hypothetical protein
MTDATKDLITVLATPILTFLGLVVGYLFSRYKSVSEANKLNAEKESLELKNNVDTVKFYTDMISSLRTEVKLHSYQIEELANKLNIAEEQKRQLKLENEKLLLIVEEQGKQIVFLQSEIDKLNNERKPNDSDLPISSPS